MANVVCQMCRVCNQCATSLCLNKIIEALNLKHLKPEDIGDDQPLSVEGLGLDSIDALELIVLLQQHYNIRLLSEAQ